MFHQANQLITKCKNKSYPVVTICGETQLNGSIDAQGDKTAGLLLIASACAIEGETSIYGLPLVSDIQVGLKLAAKLREIRYEGLAIVIGKPQQQKVISLKHAYCRSIRHVMSFVAAGVTLGKVIEFSFPGGDAFCSRPIDVHLNLIGKYGVIIYEIGHGRFRAIPPRVQQSIKMDVSVKGIGPSVGGTCTALILANQLSSKSLIYNYSVDPQVTIVVELFRRSGCTIKLTDHILEVSRKDSISHISVMTPVDRIVLANIALIAGMCNGCITVKGLRGALLDDATSSMLSEFGITYEYKNDSITFQIVDGLKTINATSRPFPGLSTDILPLCSAAATCSYGKSIFTELIYPVRNSHLLLFTKFGIESSISGNSYFVYGRPECIKAAKVQPTDIRAAAAALQIALIAKGTSVLFNSFHLFRGYENWYDRLRSLGAKIELS